jgi:hypothetical protein
MRKPERFEPNALCLDPCGTADDVFRAAAKGMKESVKKAGTRKLLKMHLAEILYRGKRHEVWLNKLQVRNRTEEALAGYVKMKCLGLED